jgi:ribosomal-protein-alanine N-acetyltransferase
MSIVVIAAGPAHAEIVAALHAATISAEDAPASGGAWDAAWVARILALPGASAFLALAPDPAAPAGPVGPVGFALCLPAGAAFDLVAIGVLAPQRRGGIARQLLARCEDHARAAGAARLMLEVADDNQAARAFYARAGFAAVGRRKAYYRARPGGAARDALVLSKTL